VKANPPEHSSDKAPYGQDEQLFSSVRSRDSTTLNSGQTVSMLGRILVSCFSAVLGVMVHTTLTTESVAETRQGLAAILSFLLLAVVLAMLLPIHICIGRDLRAAATKWSIRHPVADRRLRAFVATLASIASIGAAILIPALPLESTLAGWMGGAAMAVYAWFFWFKHKPPRPDVELAAFEYATAGTGETRLAVASVESGVQQINSELNDMRQTLDAFRNEMAQRSPDVGIQWSAPSTSLSERIVVWIRSHGLHATRSGHA